MIAALEVLTLVVAGVMVGVEFAVAFVLNPILTALPDDSTLQGRAHGGRMLGAAMPIWYLTSLGLVTAWAVAGRHQDGISLVLTAGALLVVSVVMSVALLVPINNRSKTWTAGNRPADWKQQGAEWDRYHYLRVAIIIAAFALLAAARG